MEIPGPVIIFIAAAGASAFGTLIGGASLITISTLILLGLPPHMAIGTDRFGVIGIGVAGLFKFHRKKMIDFRLSTLLAIPTLLGSICLTTSAATVFGLSGSIDFSLGGSMLLGCLCGSYLGAHFSHVVGNLWIKRFFVVVLTIMIVKMALAL